MAVYTQQTRHAAGCVRDACYQHSKGRIQPSSADAQLENHGKELTWFSQGYVRLPQPVVADYYRGINSPHVIPYSVFYSRSPL